MADSSVKDNMQQLVAAVSGEEDEDVNEAKADNQSIAWKDKIRTFMGVSVLNVSEVDAVNQSFRLRMHLVIRRELSKEELSLYSNDEMNFEPIMQFSIEPLFAKEMIELEPITFNNGKTFKITDFSNNKNSKNYGLFNDNICFMQVFRADIIFAANLKLKNFPFDVQYLSFHFDLRCDVEDKKHGIYNYYLLKEGGIYFYEYPNINGWQFVGLESSQINGGWCSQAIFRIKLRRLWRYYFDRVTVILGIVSLMTLACFFFGEDSIGDRFGFISTTLLTVVAYMSVTVTFIPQINYLTILDKYVFFSFFYILMIAMETSILAVIYNVFEESDILDQTAIDHVLLLINFTIYIIVHFIFYIKSKNAYLEENEKIGMIKEEFDKNNLHKLESDEIQLDGRDIVRFKDDCKLVETMPVGMETNLFGTQTKYNVALRTSWQGTPFTEIY